MVMLMRPMMLMILMMLFLYHFRETHTLHRPVLLSGYLNMDTHNIQLMYVCECLCVGGLCILCVLVCFCVAIVCCNCVLRQPSDARNFQLANLCVNVCVYVCVYACVYARARK